MNMQGEYVCKHCSKTIDHVLYIENGELNFPGGERTGGDRDTGEQILLCPECYKGIRYTELQNAGVLIPQENTNQSKEWCCWTLSSDDITGIAKEKGISLAGKDIDDIARRVIKGIQWSLDEQWELIVANAILDSKTE